MIATLVADLTAARVDTERAGECHAHAITLTRLAAEVVDAAMRLPSTDPMRLLSYATALRQGANAYTTAAEQLEQQAAQHQARAAVTA